MKKLWLFVVSEIGREFCKFIGDLLLCMLGIAVGGVVFYKEKRFSYKFTTTLPLACYNFSKPMLSSIMTGLPKYNLSIGFILFWSFLVGPTCNKNVSTWCGGYLLEAVFLKIWHISVFSCFVNLLQFYVWVCRKVYNSWIECIMNMLFFQAICS